VNEDASAEEVDAKADDAEELHERAMARFSIVDGGGRGRFWGGSLRRSAASSERIAHYRGRCEVDRGYGAVLLDVCISL
jgi:hypothetical protein